MRNYVLASIAVMPLLLGFSQAAQNWSVDPPTQPWVFSSDEGGTGSYLGVDIADISAERLSTLKLKEEKGVEVTMVDQDAPAGKAGIKEHDVILTMNGTAIESGAQLRRMIHETPSGRVINLGLSRDGQPMSIKVQLGDKKQMYSFATPKPDFHVQIPEIHVMPDIDIPAMNMVVVTSSARSGLMVENITPQLGEFFGVKNGDGVLVRSVEKGSRAEKAGFRAGDVIVKINEQPVHDTSDFSHAVKSRSVNTVKVSVVRDKKEQNLNLALPERKESSWFEEESLEEPTVNAESLFEYSRLQEEVAKLRPQMELAMQDARKATAEAQKTYCREAKRYEERAKEQAQRAQRQLHSQQERMKRQLERMTQEMRGAWMEI